MDLAAPPSDVSRACAQVLPPSPEVLFETHEPLVESIVNRFLARRQIQSMERDDLLQEGRIGLHVATQRFCPARGPFENFASHCILGAIRNALRDAGEPESTLGLTPPDVGELVEPSHDSAAEARVTLCQLFERIEERDRRAIELHYLLGYTKAEVARKLGISERHAARVIDAAMEQLQVLASDRP